jgi:FkbM family methyltransferase
LKRKGRNISFLLFSGFFQSFVGKGLLLIPGVPTLHLFLFDLLKPHGIALVKIQRNKMLLDAEDQGMGLPLLVSGIYETLETRFFTKLIRPNMVVVDIGANIGYYTLIAARLLRKSGIVYAFEPERSNYELLVKNIRINNFSNVVSINKAASNKNGETELFLDKTGSGGHSFSQSNTTETAGSAHIETISLDSFFENTIRNTRVDLIKIDAQGAEGLIIEGAEKILENNDVRIIMEFAPECLRRVGTDPNLLLRKLESLGFKIKYASKKDEILDITNLVEICDSSVPNFVNLFLEKQQNQQLFNVAKTEGGYFDQAYQSEPGNTF